MLLFLLFLSYVAFVNSAPCVNTNGVSENDDVAGCMCTNIDSGESQQCVAPKCGGQVNKIDTGGVIAIIAI